MAKSQESEIMNLYAGLVEYGDPGSVEKLVRTLAQKVEFADTEFKHIVSEAHWLIEHSGIAQAAVIRDFGRRLLRKSANAVERLDQ